VPLDLIPVDAASLVRSDIDACGSGRFAGTLPRLVPALGIAAPWVSAEPLHLADLAVEPFKAKVVRGLLRLLNACGPLDAGEIGEAWRRGEQLAGYVALPAHLQVLRDWLDASPAFGNREDLYSPAVGVPVDPITSTLARILESFPEGLDRATLRERALEAELNPATFAVATTYNPILEHAGRDLWRLRHHRAHAQHPPTVRRRPRRRPGAPAATRWTWGPTGHLLLTARLPHTESPVVNIPAAVSTLLEGTEFSLDESPGRGSGLLTFRNGTSWGYQSFLTAEGAGPDDELIVSLNLATKTARLSLSRSESR